MAVSKLAAFNGTAQQHQQLLDVIAKYKTEQGTLIQILHEAQEIYGYLPIEVQTTIAEQLNISLEEVYSVVTFYTRFSIYPKGQNQISVCLGTACYVKGSGEIIEKLKQHFGIEVGECTRDGRFSIEATRCIGACGLAPVMTVNSDVYGRLEPKDINDILRKYEG